MQSYQPLGDDWFTWDPDYIECYPHMPDVVLGEPGTSGKMATILRTSTTKASVIAGDLPVESVRLTGRTYLPVKL